MRTLNKYFIFSDVHGEYDALLNALNEAGYDRNNPTHKLVSLGDNFDRGKQSRDIFLFLGNKGAICVKGNHDLFLQEYLEKGMDGEFVLFNILHNGLEETIKSFSNLIDRAYINVQELELARKNINNQYSSLLKWLQEMPLYYETEHCIFTHAGINPNLSNWKETDEHFMTWDIENSCNPCLNTKKVVFIGHHHAYRVKQQAKEKGFNVTDIEKDKPELYFPEDGTSHKILSFGNKDEHSPYIGGNKIAIDGCTNLTKKVNVVVIEDYPLQEKKEEKKEDTSNEKNVTYASYNKDGFTYSVNFNDINTMTVNGPTWMPF